MRARLGVAVVATAAVLIAGCGGGSSSSTTVASGTALSKSEFLAKGNAICAKGNQEINAAGKKVFGHNAPSQADLDKFANDTLIPNIQQQIDGLKALPPPAGDEDQVNAILTAAQSGLDKAKQDPSLITSQGGSDPFAQANKLANAYGLTKCGSG